MKFIFYDPSMREEWDQFVLAHPHGTLGHLSCNFLLVSDNPNVSNRSILMYREPAQLVGILPLHETSSVSRRAIKMRVLASSRGPLIQHNVGLAEQRQLLDSMMQRVKQLADDRDVDRISITYPSMIEEKLAIECFGILPLRKYGFFENNMLGTYLDLRRDEADLLMSLHKNCRQTIRKAEKDGLQVSIIEDREEWMACEPLNRQTLGSQMHSRHAMEVMWDEFIVRGYAQAFVAKHENRAVSVVTMQIFRNWALYCWSFNRRPIFTGGNNLALWQAILHAKRAGVTFFMMGTYEFTEDPKLQGISDFKLSYGGTPYYVIGGTFLRKRVKHHAMLFANEAARHLRSQYRNWRGPLKQDGGLPGVKKTERRTDARQ